MTLGTKIGIALVVCIAVIVSMIWTISNARGQKMRGRRRPSGDRATQAKGDALSQRQGDLRQLSGTEKKLYQESQRLLAQGKVAPAARILEQLNMQREAIQALEDVGLVHDAAKILMRMGRPNRAGVIYARHGMWDHAAQSFKMASMPLEAAKCAREAGLWQMAAENFEKVGRLEDAADCYTELGDLHRAARHYASAGNTARAMETYNRLGKQAENLGAIDFHDEELQQIAAYLGEGHTDQGLTAVVVSRNKLTDVIINLVGKGKLAQAVELYQRANTDLGPMLMAEVRYQTRAEETLADLFMQVANFRYAGMMYERMNAFDRAGEAFFRHEDYDRASYCYERAGQDAKAREAKNRAHGQPNAKGRSAALHARSGFALAQVAGDTDARIQAQARPPAFDPDSGDEESTKLLGLGRDSDGLEPSMPLADSQASALTQPGTPAEKARPRTPLPPPRPAFPAPVADDRPHPPIFKLENEDRSKSEATAPEDAVTVNEGLAAFHRAKFFADLDFEQRVKLWTVGATIEFAEGETILNYDDEPRGVYIVVSGSVSCYRLVSGRESYVDRMGESETFGELWLLADQPTAVRFVASKDTRIRVIDRVAFNELMDKDGTIARKVYKRFTMRLLKRLLKPQTVKGNKAAS